MPRNLIGAATGDSKVPYTWDVLLTDRSTSC